MQYFSLKQAEILHFFMFTFKYISGIILVVNKLIFEVNIMAIYRNVIVDVPDGAYVEKDATVFVKDKNEYDPLKQYNRVKHTIIGKSIGNGRMYPNHNFRLRYPTVFEEASGGNLPRQTTKIGFYTTVLSLVERTGLYEALYKSYGIENANMIIDFSMYSILHHSCVADQYPSTMKDQLLFSNSIWNGSKLSEFFNNEISEEKTSSFKKIWAEKCSERDIDEAWIAIDGSNNDCEAQKVVIAEPGKAKSHKNVSIVSYMYAVDSRNGDPITFSVYRGGRVDCKAVIEMIGWLKAYDIKVKGVIVDRGFATKEVFELLERNEMNYVAMLKGDVKAHTAMVGMNANKIRMKYEYMLGKYQPTEDTDATTKFVVNSKILYGIEANEKIQLFSTHDYKAFVSLIYDSTNGLERQETWFQKVSNKARQIQQQLTFGKDSKVPKEYVDCITIEERNEKKVVLVNEEKVQEKGECKGFYSLASSQNLTAKEANEIYVLRNSSEEQFSMVKSQLGFATTGTHYEEGVRGKLALAFISAIIRNELVKSSRECEFSTNRMINELNQICMHMNGKDEYFVCHTENQRQISFMKACGVLPKNLDRIAEDENKRLASIEPDPYHHYPEHKHEDESAHRGPGRPKGSKNQIQKKIIKDLIEGEQKKPGRPKGSKNKKTLVKEAMEEKANIKRSPGRPKGSRNKPKIDIEVPKRKRGRPRKSDK